MITCIYSITWATWIICASVIISARWTACITTTIAVRCQLGRVNRPPTKTSRTTKTSHCAATAMPRSVSRRHISDLVTGKLMSLVCHLLVVGLWRSFSKFIFVQCSMRMCCEKKTMIGWRNVWSMNWRVPSQEVDQRKLGEKLWKRLLGT